MKCSTSFMKIFIGLHMIALVTTVIGLYKEIYDIDNDKDFPLALSLTISGLMSLSLPSKICDAIIRPHNWLNVIGTILIIVGNIIISYKISNKY